MTDNPNDLAAVPCPFCSISPERIIDQTDLCLVLRDGFPVSPGHTLIVPRRHVASFFEITSAELEDILNLLANARTVLEEELHPAGYNIGINDGEAAGQTVMHLHLHLIPRFEGDTADPRGGIRWIFPDKANYWED